VTVGLRNGINVQFTNAGIADSLGNAIVTYTQVIAPGSGVNYLDFSNEISGAAPAATAKGLDDNINLRLQGKGVTGYVEIVGTGAMILPIGTTGEQPAGAAGEFRYNSTTGLIEWYDAVAAVWKSVSSVAGSVVSISGTANQILVGGTATVPVLSLSPTLIAPGTVTVSNMLLDTNTWSSTSGALNITPLSGEDLNITLASGGELFLTGAMDLIHTATENDDHALEIECNAAGFGDVKALDISYVTGAVAGGSDEAAILINVDESLSTGGHVAALEVLTTTEGSADIYGVETFAGVNPVLQSSGAFGNMDSALNKAVDVLAALSSGGAGNITIFVADNDTITIGDAAKFEEMEIIIDTPSSGSGIQPTFEYSDGVGSWVTFTPTDGTNGFRNSGAIAWLVGDLPTWAVGTGAEFLIRITRTRNSVSTTPILTEVQIAATTEYLWDKDGAVNVKSMDIDASQAYKVAGVDILADSAGVMTLSNIDKIDPTTAKTMDIANYALDAVGSDSYAVTLDPIPAAYYNGMAVKAKVATANTGAATIDVNSLGAIAINKLNDQALETGDIEANQIIELVYNSTGPKFQMQSQVAATPSVAAGDKMVQTVVVTHAFSAGDWVYLNGSVWTLASNASAATAEKVGYISAISTTVSFTLQMGGYITSGLSGLTAGQVSFLGVGGAATTTEPSAVGEVILPLYAAQTTTTAIMLTYRGEIIGAANTYIEQDGSQIFAADAEASDTYVITLSPVPSSLATGMVVSFSANTANTDGATLNVNSLGAKAILKNHDTALATGDIEAGQVVTVVYDGTQFQMQSQTASGGGASAATQAEQETGTDITVFVSPGRQQYHPSAAKMYVLANTSGGVGTTYNVTSVTDVGVGVLTVTIATDFSAADYVIANNIINSVGGSAASTLALNVRNPLAVGSFTADIVNLSTFAGTDPILWNFTAFGDQ